MNVANNLARGVPKFHRITPMGDWVDQAACHGLNPNLFHPIRGEHTTIAVSICDTCPVQRECLGWALATNQKQGIWGGLSACARREIRIRTDA